jgi:hypothetical protein
MAEPSRRMACYEDRCSISENMIGEIIDGEFITTPRPSIEHATAGTLLGSELVSLCQLGRGGDSRGWFILYGLELWIGENFLVPDRSGWKKERLAAILTKNWSAASPYGVCEVLSQTTIRACSHSRDGASQQKRTAPPKDLLRSLPSLISMWLFQEKLFEGVTVNRSPVSRRSRWSIGAQSTSGVPMEDSGRAWATNRSLVSRAGARFLKGVVVEQFRFRA